ncbi:MAG: ring-1,2-phenylacetyl-CoA epoxidase subunit PaaD [Bacteroidia bacterium]
MLTASFIRESLKEVKDPEIPTISLVDLGIVTKIDVEGTTVSVQLTPTFAGCPALKIMEELVHDHLVALDGIDEVKVVTNFDVQWNTDMISEDGRAALLKHGLAPPKKLDGYLELDVLSDTPCPFCNSRNTTLKSPFGPTLCRSLHYCNNCKQAFEGFKPIE